MRVERVACGRDPLAAATGFDERIRLAGGWGGVGSGECAGLRQGPALGTRARGGEAASVLEADCACAGRSRLLSRELISGGTGVFN